MTLPSVYLQSKPIKKDTFICGFAFFFFNLSLAAFEVYVPRWIFEPIYTFSIFMETLHGFLGTLLAISTRKKANYISH